MRLFKASLLALAALSSTAALSATSSVTLNVSLNFYDTTPLDGVGPSFSFLSNTYAWSRTGIDNNPFPSIRDDSTWVSATTNADGAANSYVDYQPLVSTQGAFVEYVLPVGGTTARVWAESYISRYIELGAGTGVEVTTSSLIDAVGLTQSQVASDTSRVTIGYPTGFYEGPYLTCCGFGASKSISGGGTVSYENNDSQPINIHVYSHASAELTSYSLSAVPEPETYALLLAGLGIVGSVARRRRSK